MVTMVTVITMVTGVTPLLTTLISSQSEGIVPFLTLIRGRVTDLKGFRLTPALPLLLRYLHYRCYHPVAPSQAISLCPHHEPATASMPARPMPIHDSLPMPQLYAPVGVVTHLLSSHGDHSRPLPF